MADLDWTAKAYEPDPEDAPTRAEAEAEAWELRSMWLRRFARSEVPTRGGEDPWCAGADQ